MTLSLKVLTLKQLKHFHIEMSSKNFLNWFFVTEVILFGLIITGVLPRETALYLGAGLVIYFLFTSLENSIIFFVRSIPLFLALPLTSSFDNFNVWRILAVVIFLKWFWPRIMNYELGIRKLKKLFIIHYSLFTKLLIILFLLAILSIIPAPDKMAAIKRIIYFLNFALFGIVIYHKVIDKDFTKRLIKNSVIPIVIVAVVGYLQIISTYFIDIYQFMRIWGEGIQCRQFGVEWCNIAVWFGNTWFAYYGEQLSLRIFSLFPDSHSFPQFVLLGIPAILATFWRETLNSKLETLDKFKIINSKFKIPLILAILFLIIILSGTRGIWAASVGVVILALGIIFYTKNKKGLILKLSYDNFRIIKRLTIYLMVFFATFAVAFPIFSSPQFLVGKSDSEILKARIKSIVDFGETSNSQRIEIWKKTLVSIKERPLLGVGIGNYPVVLQQDIRLAKAGSSAHNLYLHVAAEMGILVGLIFIWFLWLVFKKNYEIFAKEDDRELATYFSATLLFVPWILIYSFTDIAIFDERALLMFTMVISLILGRSKMWQPRTNLFR